MKKVRHITKGYSAFKVKGKKVKNKLLEARFVEYQDMPFQMIEVFFKPTFLEITSRWEAKRTKRNLKQLIAFIDKQKARLDDV